MLLAVGIDALVKLGLDRVGLGQLDDLELMARIFNEWNWAVAVLVIGVGAALSEELMFRGFLGRGLVGHYGWIPGVLLTAILFGLIHLNIRQAAYATVMGVLLHFVYATTRSLWMPMLLHFLNNSASVLLMRVPGLEKVEDPITSSGVNPGWVCFFVGSQVLLAAACWALYRSRVRLQEKRPPGIYDWKPIYPGVELPPPDSPYRAVYPRPDLPGLSAVAAALGLFAALAWLGIQLF
jgi:membrane protease YdiL (CAAX protease family)